MGKLRDGFSSNSPQGIQLEGFLTPAAYHSLLSAVAKASLQRSETRDTHSYFSAHVPALLFFSSPPFLSFASAVTGKYLSTAETEIRMFMPGCYTLLHDELTTDALEFSLDLTPEWNNAHGGYIAALTENGTLLVMPQAPNTLILITSGRSYVKYVNHSASKQGRLLVHGLLR